MLRELLYELVYRASQNWRDTPTYYIHAVIFLSTTVLLRGVFKNSKAPQCPSVYAWRFPLAGLWGKLKSSLHFTFFLTKAYDKYLVGHIPCTMPDAIYGSTSTLILLPASALKWMLKQPDSVLDHHGESQQGVQEMRHLSWQAETPFEHPVHGASTHGWMQRWVSAQFDASKDDTMAAICSGLDHCWGKDTEAWTEVNLLDSLMPIFHQYTWRAIVGAPLDKNRDLWKYGYIVSALSIPASLILHLFPARLRSTVALVVGLPSKYVFWRLEGIIMPLIQQRISEFKAGNDRHLNDYISWAVRNDAQQRGIDEDTPRRIVSLVVSLSMLMNTSPSIVTHGLDELLQSPRKQAYEERLRVERQRALHEEDGHWTKGTLGRLYGLDSMLREVLRLHPIAAVAPVQTVVADEIEIPIASNGGDLSGSIRVRKGTRVGIPAQNIHMDEAYYENPNEFDPWRFMSNIPRQRLETQSCKDEDTKPYGGTSKKQQALLSPSNMWFGWGMGKGSCPGRWIAHDTLKLVFSAILMKYEIRAAVSPESLLVRGELELEMEREERSNKGPPSRFGPFLPPTNRKILIRRRKAT